MENTNFDEELGRPPARVENVSAYLSYKTFFLKTIKSFKSV